MGQHGPYIFVDASDRLPAAVERLKERDDA